MITAQYIKEFFEKRDKKNPFIVKTRYGKQLGEKFSVNNQKASEWLATKARENSRRDGKS